MSVLSRDDRFVTGINYWPRSSAMYAWSRFDAGEWREDFARIKALDFDLVRFFLSWDDFAPAADSMSERALEDCAAVMEALQDAGLRGMPTLFCGHMSGVNWLPSWALDPAVAHGRFRTISGGAEQAYGIGDFYADPGLLAAQRRFCSSLAERIGDHPALACWDLGNEFSNLREPASAAQAREWSVQLSAALAQHSHAPVTGGTHGEDLTRDRNLRLSSICEPWPFACMHGYSVYSEFAAGRLDSDVVPFLSRLAHAFSTKPVLFAEYGNPTCPPGMRSGAGTIALPGEPGFGARATGAADEAPYVCLSEDEMAGYGEAVFEKLHRDGAIGALWWCWADYDPALATLPPFDAAPHELSFGIIRADGSEKPIAGRLARLARERRTVLRAPRPEIDEAEHYRGLPASTTREYARYRAAAERTTR